MVQRERLCIFCLKPFFAKSKKARYCCSENRVKYFRREKRRKKKQAKLVQEKLIRTQTLRHDLQLRLEVLENNQAKITAAINGIKQYLSGEKYEQALAPFVSLLK